MPLVRARSITLALALLGVPTAPCPALAGQFDGQPIASVSVTGLRNVKESVVLDQIELRPGGTYLSSTADADVVRLERLRVFSAVGITPARTEDGVAVTVAVAETFRILPAVSIGLSDESGASVGPALKVLSIGGHPHEVSASFRFGGESLVELSEISPYLTNGSLWHSTDLSIRDRENGLDHFAEHSLDFDARVGMRHTANLRTGAVFQAYRVQSHEDGITLSPDNTDKFLGVGAVLERDTRDSWITPTRGWWNSVDVIWHFGDGDYGTVNLDIRRFQPVTPRQTLLATALLTVQSGERGVNIPTYNDFAIGGANSVRGWDFASSRGKHQFIATLEHRYTVLPTRPLHLKGMNLYGGIALALFGDVGSAWSEADAFSDNVIGGGGVGLRFYVPFLDVLRLDFTVGHDVHTTIGINEKAVAQRNRVR